MSPEIPFFEKLQRIYGPGKIRPVTPVQIQRHIEERQSTDQIENKPPHLEKKSIGERKIRKRKIRTRVKKRKHQGNNGRR